MMRGWRGWGLAALLMTVGAGYAVHAADTQQSDTEAGRRWWAHVQYLADDKLEGRETGSTGYAKAAEYVADHFKQYGLQPAGVNGYLQPVHFEVQRVVEAKSRLALVSDGKEEPLTLGEDALFGARWPEPSSISAPLVFVGYGLHLPEAKYDDLAGQDLKGKVVLYINGGPASLPGALKSHARAAQEFPKAIEGSGAVGAISIPNPKSMDIPWSRMRLFSQQPGMWLADKGLEDTRGPLMSAVFNPAHADRLFAGSGHSLSELLALADAGKPLPRFALKPSVKATVVTTRQQVESPNVVGLLPGSDPQLKREYVVVSAHLDHIGVGEPIKGDRIYNGAMDDASGVATVLETARAMHAAGAKPKRSVLFVAFCAEEKGLLGARYFAGHPTVPAPAIAADLNLDMFLPLFPLHLLQVEGLEESTLGDDVRAVSSVAGVQVVPDRQPDRNIFIRMDQYNFIRAGVPSVALIFGSAPGSPEEKTQLEWLKNNYHAPSDDANQPVDLAAAAKFNQIFLALTERVADESTRPAWKQSSFFRRFAHANGS